MSTNVPPLNGDRNGVFRIVIHGNSGTGKTTLSDRLGQVLNLPVIHLDEIHWRPNWTEAPDEEMVEELRVIIERGKASNTGWIVDGNYENCTKRIMDFEATDLISRSRYLPRFEEDKALDGGKWRRLGDIDEQQKWLEGVQRHIKTS
ncbi:4592_t:CDS:2 [Acaulospora colombiana]|uniref:4592_t:CDS:1 n=1 Tax=Acaulospora colombiana TaxID=27376 RepID=A0ACA9M0C2_9GLOM|nr:4592_t:CDS:2 [Acaulospora colombiana]